MAGISDPNGVHNPATGTSPPASWGDLVRDDVVWLAGDAASGNPKPMCRVYNNANQSTATATFTALSFNSERYDVGGCHSTSVNPERVVIPTGGGGIYHITGNVQFASNGTGARSLLIQLNGATYIASVSSPPTGTILDSLQVSCDYKLAAGDYIALISYQSSGGLLDVVNAPNFSPEFACHWVGLG